MYVCIAMQSNIIHIRFNLLSLSLLDLCRPEADDVRAMQQQLSSLHLVIEQSASEHEKQLQLVVSERDRETAERQR